LKKVVTLDNLKWKPVSSQVDDLKAKLAIQEVELKQKNDAADALIEIVRVETEKVSTEKALGMMQCELCLRCNIHVWKYTESVIRKKY
jgi:hypothetical protein